MNSLFFFFQPPAHQPGKKRRGKVGGKRYRTVDCDQPVNLCMRDVTENNTLQATQPLNLVLPTSAPPRVSVDEDDGFNMTQSQPLDLKVTPSTLLPVIGQGTLDGVLKDMTAYYENISDAVSIDTLYRCQSI